MSSARWPASRLIHVADLRVPASMLPTELAGQAGQEGLVPVDLLIEDGRIADVLPPGTVISVPRYEARGGQAWSTFADLHTHLDKGHIWPRASNPDGTIPSARASTRQDTMAHWRGADVEARFEFGLKAAHAHGTSAIRTHLDCFVPGQAEISFGVFRRLRERWEGRIALQASALVGPDLYDDPQNAALVDLVSSVDGKLGGPVYRLDDTDDPRILDGRLERLFALAAARGLEVDLHVDENGSRASMTLAQIAEAVIRNGFEGKVVCGHCCSLSVLDEVEAARTIRLVKEAGITVVSLPMVNQYLQGRRPDQTPTWRGLTLLRELRAAGVPVALASDNCRDPFHQFGDHDPLEVFGCGVRLGHLDLDIENWPSAVTTIPAAVMGVPAPLQRGAAADFILFNGRTYSELLGRRQADRLVIRGGRATDNALPDFRDLDDILSS